MSTLHITPYRPDERIQPFIPDHSIFLELGETGIRSMISDFYDLLIMSDIKEMFPQSKKGFAMAKERAADFIIQRFGGPDYYEQRRGKPLLSKRHAPFSITPEGRITWLKCYRQVIETIPVSEKTRQEYWRFIDEFSTWMVNTPSPAKRFDAVRPIR